MSISISILAFLLILTFISRNYLLQKQTIPELHSAYLRCKQLAREKRNALEVETYLAYAKANKPKPKKKEPSCSQPTTASHIPRTEKETIDYEKRRTERRSSKRSTLNLAPLATSSILCPVATRLLLSLYEGTSLFKNREADLEKLVSLILDALLTQKGDSLAERLKEMRAHHPILYKMLKGTSTYNIKTNSGYPPLSDFFTIAPKNPKAIHFHYASAPLLDALFSARIRHLFYKLERKKWEAFSRSPYVNISELFAILVKEKKSGEFEEIEPYLIFAR